MTVLEERRVVVGNRVAPRVLLVEDSPSDAAIVRALLHDTGAGVEVTVADSVATATARLGAGAFDCVLLDLGLPDASGLETLASVQQVAPGVAIVVLTGLADDALGLAAVAAGAQDYLVKAADSGASLLRSIRYAVERQHAVEVVNRLAAIVDASEDAILRERLDGTIESWNRGAELLYGYASDEAVGRNADMLASAEHVDALHALLRQCGAGESMNVETTRVTKSGQSVDVSLRMSPIRTPDGRVVAISTITRDITRRRESDARLEFQADLLDSAGQAIVAVDMRGAITYWNRAAHRLYGWTVQEALGRPLLELIPVEVSDEQVSEILATLAAGEPWSGDVWVKDRAGRQFPAFMTDTPILDDAAGMVGIIGVSSDITERRALEDRLHQGQRLESLGQLAGGIAHDFNNILMVILNYADLIEHDTDGELRDHAEQIVRAAQGAARLTKQLLTFARREPLAVQPVDLNEVVTSIHDLLARTIGEHIELAVDTADVPIIRADRGQVEQVLLNLVVNARDAMPAGGTLAITTTVVEVADDSAHHIDDLDPGAYVRLEVRDTGSGMSAAVVSRVFEPFFTTKSKGEGSGLGLATVYGIAREAGGTVDVDSVEGTGTAIGVYFPVLADAASFEQGREVREPGIVRGATVLVVEDQPAVRAVTVNMLQRLGCVVTDAASAGEALAIAWEREFDLLLTDVVMPDMSGRDLVDLVRSARPSQRVLYMSGYTDGALGATRTLDEGVALLHKPFDGDALLEAVSAAIAPVLTRTAR